MTRTARALSWEGEPGDVRTLTNSELRAAVERAARAFRALGVGPGDRVGIFLPMLPETVVTVLALGLLGAIYTPIFSGLRRAGGRESSRRLRREAARDGRRVLAPRQAREPQGDRGRGSGRRLRRSSG